MGRTFVHFDYRRRTENANDSDSMNENDNNNTNDKEDNNNDNYVNNDHDGNPLEAEMARNPRALGKMKRPHAFFNKEAADYARNTLGHMNATKIEDNADVESIRGTTSLTLCLLPTKM